MKNAHTVVNPIMSFNPFYRIVYTACILIVISSPLTMNEWMSLYVNCRGDGPHIMIIFFLLWKHIAKLSAGGVVASLYVVQVCVVV